jgi:hypothetical protein
MSICFWCACAYARVDGWPHCRERLRTARRVPKPHACSLRTWLGDALRKLPVPCTASASVPLARMHLPIRAATLALRGQHPPAYRGRAATRSVVHRLTQGQAHPKAVTIHHKSRQSRQCPHGAGNPKPTLCHTLCFMLTASHLSFAPCVQSVHSIFTGQINNSKE